MSKGEGNQPSHTPPNGDRGPEFILFGNMEQVSPQTLEERAVAIGEALGNVGLRGAEKLTATSLKSLGREALGSLNTFTAESVYFNLVRRSRRWLGRELIYPKQFLQQVKFIQRIHGNLEVFQLKQRLGDLDYLYELGFNSDQLRDLLRRSEAEQQNINRLGFLLESDPPHWVRLKPGQARSWIEPKLRHHVERLRSNAELEGPWNIETAVIEAQEILQRELEDIDGKSTKEDRRQWDSVANDLHDRVTHRLGSSIAIGHVILYSLRNSDFYPPQPEE